MPRQRRVHIPGALYHAVLRGNHRQAIFNGGDDYVGFEEIVAAALERYGAMLLAYCWMSNHVHLAIRIGEAPLGEVMRTVASRYARLRQSAVPTTGHLFERRYRARLVEAERYLLALVRYIHLNPVRAGMVADARDYRWSSHRAYLGGVCPGWLRIDEVLAIFGASPGAARVAYWQFMRAEPDPAEREQVSVLPRVSPQPPGALPAPGRRDSVRGARTLEAITAEVAREFGLEADALLSRQRRGSLVRARVEIARRALREGVATLSLVARHLGRAPSTLSDLLHGRGEARQPKP